jgi:hypothetical protein
LFRLDPLVGKRNSSFVAEVAIRTLSNRSTTTKGEVVNLSPGRVTRAVRARFWVESVLGSAAALLAILTTFWHDWIETVFRADPDHGNGGLEWAVVAVLAMFAATLLMFALSEWRYYTVRRLAVVTQR